ncbi:MAG: hypothetical protein ABH842_00925 [Candidatus Micrarchaeota archaeon]
MIRNKKRILVKDGILVQGGAFRIDKGPTRTEIVSFRLAVTLVEELRKDGKNVKLGCIVNDLALKPDKRPKTTGIFEWPEEYLERLRDARIYPPDVRIYYESTLRNGASQDLHRNRITHGAFKVNETTGINVPRCRSIMGKFYSTLAKEGYIQQIGYYTFEPRSEIGLGEVADKACPFGPIEGAIERGSGYQLRLEVINYLIYPDGKIQAVGVFEPEK